MVWMITLSAESQWPPAPNASLPETVFV